MQCTVSRQKADISKLKETLANSDSDLRKHLIEKTEWNTQKIDLVLEENKLLRRENTKLKERLSQIEQSQLENNVIISGQPEQPWEPYELTKERVFDTIAASLGITDLEIARKTAESTEIASCKRIGRYRMGKSRPISVTFQKKDDKQKLLENKRNLPTGIYVNEEFPSHVKRDRDMLRPILKLAKSLHHYREKSKLDRNRLIINGTSYTVQELHQLPAELAPYKASQKSTDSIIGFQGELSPWSNFHYSPFEIDNTKFNTAEHWIQYTKAKLFGDKVTATSIINSETARDAKKLSYKIQGYDAKTWRDKGYDLCLPGLKEKFLQNPILMNMLRTTSPKLLVESSFDKTWGTGIPLKDKDALNKKKLAHQWLAFQHANEYQG